MKADPLGEPRNPLAIYLLVLTLLSGISTVVGVPTSGSIEAELPTSLAKAWGTMLVLGSGASLLGVFWLGDVRTGLVVKRFGMFTLTVAAFVYGVVLIIAAGMDAAYVTGIIFGFGLATLLQWRKINRRIHAILRASR